jgi:hypothetical protein
MKFLKCFFFLGFLESLKYTCFSIFQMLQLHNPIQFKYLIGDFTTVKLVYTLNNNFKFRCFSISSCNGPSITVAIMANFIDFLTIFIPVTYFFGLVYLNLAKFAVFLSGASDLVPIPLCCRYASFLLWLRLWQGKIAQLRYNSLWYTDSS